ncbi:transposase [Nonomuraea sp. NPDC050783]|uniref:transposase n=1 Tax=Nonomuraea sp. NPDC050783 TaxID=3154634 RepID=UPI00346742AE
MGTSTTVPATSQGHDAGKKIAGRKRSTVTDTPGLLPAVLVTAAGVSDSATGLPPLATVAAAQPTLTKAWPDSACRTTVIEGAAALGIDVRLARDYEARPDRSEAMIHIAMIDVMTRRLTGENTPTRGGA